MGYAGAGGERFCPAGFRILVKPNEARSTTESGRIHIPDPAREQPNRGVVLALGLGAFHPQHGKWVDPRDFIQIGDQVVFSKYAGTEVEIDGAAMVVLSTDDLIAVIVDAAQAEAATRVERASEDHWTDRKPTDSGSPAKSQE
jgi:chaperonin GroES